MLEIAINQLDQGIHDFLLYPSPEDVKLDPAVFSNLEVAARIDFSPRRVLVVLDVSAVATLECDRTLVPYDQPVAGSFSVLFADPSVTGPDTEQDDLRPLDPDARSVDVTDAVRDTLILAVPLRRVSPQAEQIDLPLVFGASEDAVDTRWEALRPLKNQDKSTE